MSMAKWHQWRIVENGNGVKAPASKIRPGICHQWRSVMKAGGYQPAYAKKSKQLKESTKENGEEEKRNGSNNDETKRRSLSLNVKESGENK
jgi:hypothetical protein